MFHGVLLRGASQGCLLEAATPFYRAIRKGSDTATRQCCVAIKRMGSRKSAIFHEAISGLLVIAMGIHTRGLDIKADAARLAADKAARAEAKAVVDRWNEQLAVGRDMMWSPTIRTPRGYALAQSVLLGLRDESRSGSPHHQSPSARLGGHARLAVFVMPGLAPMPKLLALHALPPARRAGSVTI
jgi:hypothetical protein